MESKTIHLKGYFAGRAVWLDGKPLLPKKSQAVYNHSPDGFNWSYGGSGPAQLALAILLEVTNKEIAQANYQRFKWDIISKLPAADFECNIDLSSYCQEPTAVDQRSQS